MPDYKAMYFSLAARVADAIEVLQDGQLQGENTYMESEPQCLTVAVPEETGEDVDRA